MTFPASNASTTVASASFLLWEYSSAYRRTQLFTSGEGRGLRIFLGGARLARSKGVQMKSEGAAKTRHYAGPIKVMNVREVSAYLRVHQSTIYR